MDITPINKPLQLALFLIIILIVFFLWQFSLMDVSLPCGYEGFGILNYSTGCKIGTYCSLDPIYISKPGVCRPIIEIFYKPLVIR